MRDRIWVIAIAAAVAACASSSKPAPVVVENHPPPPPAPPAPPPPPPSHTEVVMANLDGFVKRMCACADRACADGVQDEMNRWTQDLTRSEDAGADKPTERQLQQMQELGYRYGTCMARAMDTGSTPPVPAAAVAGLPESCKRYERGIKKLPACDKVPQATKDALLDSYNQTAAAWAQVPAEGMAGLGDACRSAAEAVEQIARDCK